MPEGENGAEWTETQTEMLPYETYAHVAGRRGGLELQQPKACGENMHCCGGLLAGRNIEDVQCP